MLGHITGTASWEQLGIHQSLCLEVSCARRIRESQALLVQDRAEQLLLGVPSSPSRQAGRKGFPCSFPAESLSSCVSIRPAGVDTILRLTGDQTVTLGHSCTLFAAPRVWRLQQWASVCPSSYKPPPKSRTCGLIPGTFPFPVLAWQRAQNFLVGIPGLLGWL